jgi:isopenicillin-N epimerase
MASYLREEFELDPALAYLNWGTHSITPVRVFEAMQMHQREYETNPTQAYFESFGRMWKAQQALARWLKADEADLFLRANVTEVMNAFILGMPLETGSEILATNVEYPAIVHQCRYRSETEKVTLRTMDLPVEPGDQLTPKAIVDSVIGALKAETRLVLVSHILTGTGMVLPIRELARETRKRGVMLAVDGAHAPGSVPLDFSELGDVDFYGGNLHKWFMGPKGTAFGWVNKRLQGALRPLSVGWTTYERVQPFSDFGGGSEFQMRMAMTGCRDFAPFYAIQDTISFWKEFGDAKLREELYSVQDGFRARLEQELALQPLSPKPGPLRGPLATFVLPPGTNATTLLQRMLDRHRVQVLVTRVKGNPALRVAPHFSTSEDEMDRAIEGLKAELGS